jgi:hypothetical protein
MKKLGTIVVFITIPLFTIAQSNSDAKEKLMAIHRSWFKGLLSEDTVVINQVLSEDVTLGFPDGNTLSKEEFINYLGEGILFYDSAFHEYSKVRVYRNVGLINGRSNLAFRFKMEDGEYLKLTERLTYIAVYLFDDSIKMIAWQSTIRPRE